MVEQVLYRERDHCLLERIIEVADIVLLIWVTEHLPCTTHWNVVPMSSCITDRTAALMTDHHVAQSNKNSWRVSKLGKCQVRRVFMQDLTALVSSLHVY